MCIGPPKSTPMLGIITELIYRRSCRFLRSPHRNPHSWGLDQSHAGIPAISLGTKNSQLFRSAVSMGFTSLVWTSVLFTGCSLHLGSSSVPRLVMGVCFYFHQLLDEGYRMAYKSVINFIIRGGRNLSSVT